MGNGFLNGLVRRIGCSLDHAVKLSVNIQVSDTILDAESGDVHPRVKLLRYGIRPLGLSQQFQIIGQAPDAFLNLFDHKFGILGIFSDDRSHLLVKICSYRR